LKNWAGSLQVPPNSDSAANGCEWRGFSVCTLAFVADLQQYPCGRFSAFGSGLQQAIQFGGGNEPGEKIPLRELRSETPCRKETGLHHREDLEMAHQMVSGLEGLSVTRGRETDGRIEIISQYVIDHA
jgi:hypothetical protein